MKLEPQRRSVRCLHGWALAAFTLAAVGLGIGETSADIEVHVMNCTSNTLVAEAYDSEDSVELVSASSKSFSAGSSGESASLHCAGEGKGYCQVKIHTNDQPSACSKTKHEVTLGFHLDSGKWAVVTGFEEVEDNDGLVCRPVVEQNLDSAPTSCN